MSKLKETFVMMMHDVVESPAWHQLSLGARCLYLALKSRYRKPGKTGPGNNGSIFLSHREAARELSSQCKYIRRWFRELEYFGFIVMTRPGYLGEEGRGKAPHYRLPEAEYEGNPPTRDYLNWNGVPFAAKKKNPGGQKAPVQYGCQKAPI